VKRIFNDHGVTLLELLIAISIVAILAVTAVPSFITYLQQNRLVGATQRLYHTLQYARTEAVKRNANVYVSFVTGSNWCYGANPGATCACNTSGSCTIGSVSAPSAGQISLSATGLNSGAIYFEPNHGASSSSSTITFTTSQGDTMGVKIGLLGSLTICSSSIAGYPACS